MAKIKLGKRSFKSILLTILSTMLCVGLVFGIGAAVIQSEEQTQKTISPKFVVGTLNSGGTFTETQDSIVTEEVFSCKGLDIEIEFKNNIEYKIVFYKEDGTVAKIIENLRKNFNLKDELNNLSDSDGLNEARTCRIVITPIDDESIAFYEVYSYSKLLTIKVDKVQRFENVDTETQQESTVEETN